MSEMIERVTQAIYAKWEDRPEYAKLQMNGVLAEELARAALEAMREPSQAMLEASWHNVREVKPGDRMAVLLMSTSMAHRVKTLNRWRAMIDAALREG